MGAIAERAQLRLIQLGALAVGKEAVVEAVGAVAKEVGAVAKEDPATGPAEALTPLAREWAQVQASGDPMAVWAFAVSNPDAPEARLALSRLIPLIDAAEDLSVLQDLRIAALSRLIPLTYAAEDVSVLQDRRIAAMGAIAERAQLRLIQLGALAVGKEAVVEAVGAVAKVDAAVAKEDKVAVSASNDT